MENKMSKNKGGAKTKYSEDVLTIIDEYIQMCMDSKREVITDKGSVSRVFQEYPTPAGLAVKVGVVKKTLYNWCENHEEFLHRFNKMKTVAEYIISQMGMHGDYNYKLASAVLRQYGWDTAEEKRLTINDVAMQKLEIIGDED